MVQDLVGLTIHIAPPLGFATASEQAQLIFSEQFEALLLNTSHTLILEALSKAALSSDELDIGVEIVTHYDEETCEAWFAVGVAIAGDEQAYDDMVELLTSEPVTRKLCQTLRRVVLALLIKRAALPHLIVDVEITSYGGAWS